MSSRNVSTAYSNKQSDSESLCDSSEVFKSNELTVVEAESCEPAIVTNVTKDQSTLLTDVNDNECVHNEELVLECSYLSRGPNDLGIKNDFQIWTDSQEIKTNENNEKSSLQPGSAKHKHEKSRGFTPSFKRGVFYCSTPINHSPPPKRVKRYFHGVIEEEEEENCSEEADTQKVLSNVNREKITIGNEDSKLKDQCLLELGKNNDKQEINEGSAEPGVSTLSNECSNEFLASMAEESELVVLTSKIYSTIEKTVLQKDNLSMVFDFPHNDKEETPENKGEVDMKLSNDATIVYKDIEDRTIDEIHLNDGKLGREIEEMFNLESEEDRQRILEKAKNLQEFISPDDEENNDNNNSEWDILKKLDSDEERYRAVRQLWMNLAIPNPKENLTNFNWRKRGGKGHPRQNRLPIAPLMKKGSEDLNHHCSEVFDIAADKLTDFYQNRILGIGIDTTYEHAVMASLKKMPNEFHGGRRGFMLTRNQLHDCYQERYARTQNAKKEVEALHEFYNGLKNHRDGTNSIILLSEREHQNVLGVEDIITSYSSWYRN